MSTAVKYFTNTMVGAPVMEGPAGAMISVLDACLVNGFGLGTLDSLTVAGGIATATRAAGHPFDVGTVALIDGATPAGLNGQKRILSVTTTTYTFDATGIADQTATGTITHRVAPLGFEKVFSGTNLAVYRSPNVAGTRCYLRIDDTNTLNARACGFETMSDINTGTGLFPSFLGVQGLFWGKSNVATSSGRSWILIGDDRGFVLSVAYNGTAFQSYNFGDFASRKSPDAYACCISGSQSSQVAGTSGAQVDDLAYFNTSANANMFAPRGASGLGSSVTLRRTCAVPSGSTTGNWSGQVSSERPVYPNPGDNGLLLAPMMLSETAGSAAYRGILPGVYYAPQSIGLGVFASREAVTGVTGLSGRILRAINSNSGPMFIDATGPWR